MSTEAWTLVRPSGGCGLSQAKDSPSSFDAIRESPVKERRLPCGRVGMNAVSSLFRSLGLLPLLFGLGCGGGGGAGYNLDVGSDDGGASLALGAAGDASVSGFDAHIEQNHITVTFVTVGCTGPCADVVVGAPTWHLSGGCQ